MARGSLARLAAPLLAVLAMLAFSAEAVEVRFERVADNVYAHVGDLSARSVANEGLNANLGLVVTAAGAVLIDSGATFSSARDIHAAVRRVTSQPVRWVINTGGQDHRKDQACTHVNLRRSIYRTRAGNPYDVFVAVYSCASAFPETSRAPGRIAIPASVGPTRCAPCAVRCGRRACASRNDANSLSSSIWRRLQGPEPTVLARASYNRCFGRFHGSTLHT